MREDSASDYRFDAQQTAEKHFEAVSAALDCWEEGDQKPEAPNPAYEPYCACSICVVREILYAGWNYSQLELIEELVMRRAELPEESLAETLQYFQNQLLEENAKISAAATDALAFYNSDDYDPCDA